MDYDGIVKVVETTSPTEVSSYLRTNRWVILAVASGRTEDGCPVNLYSMGWYGYYIPDIDDHSEFPEGTVTSPAG